MVGAYFDSGVLVKNYCRESTSPEAISLILAEPPPLPLTHLQEGEVRNALRLKLFRHEITAVSLKGALSLLDEDIREGRFKRPIYDAWAVYRRAEILSQLYAATTGARMLDILHVAAALEIEAVRFISFDERQISVAKKAGLKVAPKTTVSS
jgi:predicted nucleic acid-binding protein